MHRSCLHAAPAAGLAGLAGLAAHALPLVLRTPTEWLVRAREDHATCLVLAAHYRARLARDEAAMRDRHAWALGHARTLRTRFPGALSATRASPG